MDQVIIVDVFEKLVSEAEVELEPLIKVLFEGIVMLTSVILSVESVLFTVKFIKIFEDPVSTSAGEGVFVVVVKFPARTDPIKTSVKLIRMIE